MKKWKTIVLLLILSISALVANSIHLQSEMTFNSSAAASSSSVNWSNFRGAVYRWQNLSLYPDQPFAPNPDIWFATMKNLGFNYARVGDLDWNYMMTNPTKYDALLQDVANAADANGFSVTYIFGGGDLRVYDQAFFTPDGGPYCQGSASCYSNFTADFFNNNLSLYPNGLYNGQTVWQIMFDSFIKELIQQLDGHASTVGYEIINEPHATSSQLYNYYEYELTQMRTMTTKALVLQGNAGGVGSVQDFPSSNLAPFVYEIHNYQGVLNYNPYPQTAQNCKNAGCSGVVLV